MLGFVTRYGGIEGTGGGLFGDEGRDLETLNAEAGRGGGRIGLVLSTLKKLDFLLFEEGVGGI